MATLMPVHCPICHDGLDGERLEDHLIDGHSKRTLARRLASEYELLENRDCA